jgi:hypothetical protein
MVKRAASSFVISVFALASGSAHADVDMSGRWLNSTVGGYRCLEVAQTGTALTLGTCDFPSTWTGTIDPATGAFMWDEGTNVHAEGTVAADGRTFTGTHFIYHCTFIGCGYLPFDTYGSRCGAGAVDAGEDCDVGNGDGTYRSGTCCTTECRFADAGTTCQTDADPFTDQACDADGMCLVVPPPTCDPCRVWDPVGRSCVPDVRTDCRRPATPAGRLSAVTTSPDARDSLAWTWAAGAATAPADLGDPRAATALELCLFADDGQGGVVPLLSGVVPAGGTCDGRPCWTANAGGTTYRYRNARGDGLRSLRLESGAAGAAGITLRGKGSGLGLPSSFDGALPPITIQLRRTDAPVCWESRFPVLSTSTATRIRARDGQ